MTRMLFLCLGCLMLTLGLIGALLPLMPTTIFLIMAAWCFARSSPAWEAWLLNHGHFGPPLRAWHEQGAISRPAKCTACAGMSGGFVLFWIGAHPSAWLAAGVAAMLVASALYVVSRPDPEPVAVDAERI